MEAGVPAEYAVRRAAVLGSPVAHSLSPVLHRAAYAALGLDWTYEAIECDEARLPALLEELDDAWAGLSLTMPLKRAVLPLLDEVSETAVAVGGANTVVFDGGRRRGENTDVAGMVDALREAGVSGVTSAVVLGAGATACSALAALRELGSTEVVVVARSPARATGLRAAADRLGASVRVHGWDELPALLAVDILVSTVPSGVADHLADTVLGTGPGREGDGPDAVFDVVYDPWPTRLAAAASAAGRRVVGGFDLLLHQAAHQVELMTGRSPAPIAAMRAAGERTLAERAGRREAAR